MKKKEEESGKKNKKKNKLTKKINKKKKSNSAYNFLSLYGFPSHSFFSCFLVSVFDFVVFSCFEKKKTFSFRLEVKWKTNICFSKN